MQIPASRTSVTGLLSTRLYACGIHQDLVIIYYLIKHVNETAITFWQYFFKRSFSLNCCSVLGRSRKDFDDLFSE